MMNNQAREYLYFYNQTSLAFLTKVKKFARTILKEEMGIEFKKTRFYFRGHTYPLSFVVFEDIKQLGFYDPSYYRIGLNKALMYKATDQQIKDILRHELAHMYTAIIHGSSVSAHGQEFREICQKFGWSENVSAATLQLNTNLDFGLKDDGSNSDESSKIIAKVQKILRLAASSNEHESQVATAKANQLLLEHNLKGLRDHTHSEDDDFETYLKAVAWAPRFNTKLQTIYEILGHFYVRPIINKSKQGAYLEVIGERTNVLLAEYIAAFLDRELDRLWQLTKLQNPKLKGQKAKNSFLRGVAKGHETKIRQQKSHLHTQQSKENQMALNRIERALELHVNRVYKGLSYTTSQYSDDKLARSLGEKKGEQLSINPALKNQSKMKKLLGMSFGG